MNRAFDGDIVAVELLPKSMWGQQGKDTKTIQVRDEHGVENEMEMKKRKELERRSSEVFDPNKQEESGEGGRSDGSGGSGGSDGSDGSGQGEENGTEQGTRSSTKGEEEIRPCGKIVGIVDRKWRSYCGSIEPRTGIQSSSAASSSTSGTTPTRCLFIPVKRNVPKLRLTTRQADKLR